MALPLSKIFPIELLHSHAGGYFNPNWVVNETAFAASINRNASLQYKLNHKQRERARVGSVASVGCIVIMVIQNVE